MEKAALGIIGGSGLYDLPGLHDVVEIDAGSSFGAPSDRVLSARFGALPVYFMPRHGRGHRIPPDEINYRANIDAFKRLGVTDIISVSACGSFRDTLPPGSLILPDQFIDRTTGRNSSFFGTGCVGHVSMAHPVGPALQQRIVDAAKALNEPFIFGGTYTCINGPQFSSMAESLLYKSSGADIVGMTAATEAKLAREAEITYATIGMVTDFDCWHPDHDHVSVSDVIRVLHQNVHRVRALLNEVMRAFPLERIPCPVSSHRALDYAIMTAKEARDPRLVEQLQAVAGRVFNRSS